MDPLVFDSVDLSVVPVTIAGMEYLLREPSADIAAKYRNAAAKCAKSQFVDGRVSGMSMDGIGDIEPLLVSMCLFERTAQHSLEDKGILVQVSLATVRSWPSRIVKPLFDLAKRLGDLDETASKETDAKNSRSAATGGSSQPNGSDKTLTS